MKLSRGRVPSFEQLQEARPRNSGAVGAITAFQYLSAGGHWIMGTLGCLGFQIGTIPRYIFMPSSVAK